MAQKRRKLTNKEKKANAEFKKAMQAKGIIPPDKPKLNRKKFIEEARAEWDEKRNDCYSWDIYFIKAIGYMLLQTQGISGRASLEAVGAAKVLKLALRFRQFEKELREKGVAEYKLTDEYEYVKDILDA